MSNLLLFTGPRAGGEEPEKCIACDVAFKDGDRVYSDVSGGCLHEACCDPESYVGEDEEPLKAGDPIPEPWIWGEHP